jgi:hypothetical protein
MYLAMIRERIPGRDFHGNSPCPHSSLGNYIDSFVIIFISPDELVLAFTVGLPA